MVLKELEQSRLSPKAGAILSRIRLQEYRSYLEAYRVTIEFFEDRIAMLLEQEKEPSQPQQQPFDPTPSPRRARRRVARGLQEKDEQAQWEAKETKKLRGTHHKGASGEGKIVEQKIKALAHQFSNLMAAGNIEEAQAAYVQAHVLLEEHAPALTQTQERRLRGMLSDAIGHAANLAAEPADENLLTNEDLAAELAGKTTETDESLAIYPSQFWALVRAIQEGKVKEFMLAQVTREEKERIRGFWGAVIFTLKHIFLIKVKGQQIQVELASLIDLFRIFRLALDTDSLYYSDSEYGLTMAINYHLAYNLSRLENGGALALSPDSPRQQSIIMWHVNDSEASHQQAARDTEDYFTQQMGLKVEQLPQAHRPTNIRVKDNYEGVKSEELFPRDVTDFISYLEDLVKKGVITPHGGAAWTYRWAMEEVTAERLIEKGITNPTHIDCLIKAWNETQSKKAIDKFLKLKRDGDKMTVWLCGGLYWDCLFKSFKYIVDFALRENLFIHVIINEEAIKPTKDKVNDHIKPEEVYGSMRGTYPDHLKQVKAPYVYTLNGQGVTVQADPKVKLDIYKTTKIFKEKLSEATNAKSSEDKGKQNSPIEAPKNTSVVSQLFGMVILGLLRGRLVVTYGFCVRHVGFIEHNGSICLGRFFQRTILL